MTPHAADCARKLRVLSDPTRMAVLELLFEGPRHVGELNEVLHLDQSLLSHHLRSLRDAGLVRCRRDGKAVLYSLDAAHARRRSGQRTIDLGCCALAFRED